MVKAGDATDAVIDELVAAARRGRHRGRRRQRALRGHPPARARAGREGPALRRHGRLRRRGGRARRALASWSAGPTRPTSGSGRSSSRSPRRSDGTPCCAHVGPDGAGHFVKMVHNGIEYADMQLIAEAYDLLRHLVGQEPAEIAEVFRAWNGGDLESFLIEITAEVLAHVDAETGKPFVDVVARRGRAEGHRPLDRAERPRPGRADHRHRRGHLRAQRSPGTLAQRRAARDGVRRAGRGPATSRTPRASSTTSARRC